MKNESEKRDALIPLDPRLFPPPSAQEGAGGPLAFGEEAPVMTHFRVREEYLSTRSSADFNIASAVSGSGSQETFYLRYEALLESAPQMLRRERQVWETLHAVGVQLDLKVTRIKGEFKADFFSVAMAAQLGLAQVSFSVTVLPADNDVLRGLFPPGGDLNLDNYETIIEGVAAAKKAIAALENPTPQPISRPSRFLLTSEDEMSEAQAILFAWLHLVQNESLGDARKEAIKQGLNPVIVEDAYRNLWPDAKEDTKPPKKVRDLAGKSLGW